MKYIKSISWFLGLSMLTFGVLKFVNPFKEWYSVQVTNSGLSEYSYWLGIAGEITVGITLIGILVYKGKISEKTFNGIVVAGSRIIIIMMIVGIFVHLQPEVPADVLPLKIKPPYIPGFFLLLALANIILTRRQPKRQW